MRCSNCNSELNEAGKCSHCTAETEKVHVMTSEERSGYKGITIDESSTEEPGTESGYHRPHTRVYVKRMDGNSSNWIMKVSLFLLVAAILAFVVFIALPFAMIAAGVGLVVWLVLSFLRQ